MIILINEKKINKINAGETERFIFYVRLHFVINYQYGTMLIICQDLKLLGTWLFSSKIRHKVGEVVQWGKVNLKLD